MQGGECPTRGSSQTEVQGDTLVCFSCDAMNPA